MRVLFAGHVIEYPAHEGRGLGFVTAPERKASQFFRFDGDTAEFTAAYALPRHVRERCVAVARITRKDTR